MYDTKSTYSVLLGLAGTIKFLGKVTESINSLAGQLDFDDDTNAPSIPGVSPDELAPLLVLAVELEASAQRLLLRSKALRGVRRARARTDVSGASRGGGVKPRHGIGHYEQDDEEEV